MAGKNRSGKAWKDGYSTYKAAAKYEKNRKRSLTKHVKANPTDTVAEKALASPIKYRRKKPVNPNGWTYSAFKTVDKKTRSEQMVTKEQCKFWAMALKLEKKSRNESMYLPKDVRAKLNEERRRSEKKAK